MTEIILKDEERTKCQIFTRSCGFIRPSQFSGPHKIQENFIDRKFFTEEAALKED